MILNVLKDKKVDFVKTKKLLWFQKEEKDVKTNTFFATLKI